MGSHPSWVRGLKLLREKTPKRKLLSHPSWVRGLKHIVAVMSAILNMSHPSWVRGLKHGRGGRILGRVFGRTPRGCVD